MKQRIISAAVAILLLILILFMYHTVVLNLAISLISAIAVYEVLTATSYIRNKALLTICTLFVVLVPFMTFFMQWNLMAPAVLLFVLALLLIMIAAHTTLRIEAVGLTFLIGTLIPLSLTTLVFIRDRFERDGLFLILLTLAGAWIGDTGAYFAGTFFGKHKLTPIISPKKTVEGLVGGIVSTAAAFLLMGFIYQQILAYQGTDVTVSYGMLALLGVACTLIGLIGDLSASVVKRQCSIKDFGNIMPGHGGVLDRFDSVLTVAPFMYIMLKYVTLIH